MAFEIIIKKNRFQFGFVLYHNLFITLWLESKPISMVAIQTIFFITRVKCIVIYRKIGPV